MKLIRIEMLINAPEETTPAEIFHAIEVLLQTQFSADMIECSARNEKEAQ